MCFSPNEHMQLSTSIVSARSISLTIGRRRRAAEPLGFSASAFSPRLICLRKTVDLLGELEKDLLLRPELLELQPAPFLNPVVEMRQLRPQPTRELAERELRLPAV